MNPSAYTPIVGIEIHVELATASKMFCGCKNDPFHAQKPNIYTCPVCLGMPGGLPVANKKAIEWTIKIGLALGCEISLFSKFDRKHYFYPDLPKGYQISQYDQPLCVSGLVKTEFGDVRITRVHLEEDTGKLLHQTVDGKKVSLVDFNRSSVPLVEIVTEPDIHSPEQAKAYTKKIAQIIKYLEVSGADMEQGSMRLEANISVQTSREQKDNSLPSYKVEVKNLNSFRFIERAIGYEVSRQSEIRDNGKLPTQETRGWSEKKNETFPQRSKESAEDYRYFPDPDLPPLRFTKDFIEGIRSSLPELPDAIAARWEREYGIKSEYSAILLENRRETQVLDAVFEVSAVRGFDPIKLAGLVVNKKIVVKLPENLGNGILQDVVDEVFTQAHTATQVDTIGENELENATREVIEEQTKAVSDYKSGKQQVIGFLIGMVSKKIGKKTDTAQIRTLLEKLLT